jgi:hypothetical protein
MFLGEANSPSLRNSGLKNQLHSLRLKEVASLDLCGLHGKRTQTTTRFSYERYKEVGTALIIVMFAVWG